MKTGHCEYCGKPIFLVETGVQTWKWATNARRAKHTWKCPAPDKPIRSHKPKEVE